MSVSRDTLRKPKPWRRLIRTDCGNVREGQRSKYHEYQHCDYRVEAEPVPKRRDAQRDARENERIDGEDRMHRIRKGQRGAAHVHREEIPKH